MVSRITSKKYIHDYKGNGHTIVLLHGFLASSSYWSKLQPLLTNNYRVITIDLLGFGHAPKPKDLTYSYDDHVAYLHAIFKKLNLHSFTLIGHSMGALIASRYAVLYPNSLNALILLHPPLYKSASEAQKALRSTGKHYQFFLDSRFRELGWIAMRKLPFTRISPHGRAAREGSLHHIIESAEVFDDLRQITTKTTLVIGAKDRHQYLTNITQFPLSTSVTVTHHNVNHHSPFYNPHLVHDIIQSAIKQHTPIKS